MSSVVSRTTNGQRGVEFAFKRHNSIGAASTAAGSEAGTPPIDSPCLSDPAFSDNESLALTDILDERDLEEETQSSTPRASSPPPANVSAKVVDVPAGLPSIGSVGHTDEGCKNTCCFFPMGKCRNGYDCQFCHFEHKKRKQKKGQKARKAKKEQAADVNVLGDQAPQQVAFAFRVPPGLVALSNDHREQLNVMKPHDAAQQEGVKPTVTSMVSDPPTGYWQLNASPPIPPAPTHVPQISQVGIQKPVPAMPPGLFAVRSPPPVTFPTVPPPPPFAACPPCAPAPGLSASQPTPMQHPVLPAGPPPAAPNVHASLPPRGIPVKIVLDRYECSILPLDPRIPAKKKVPERFAAKAH